MANMTSSDLLREVRNEFLLAYDQDVKLPEQLSSCMALGLSSTKRTEYYGYHESAPEFERQDRGNDMAEDEFLTRAFSVLNYRWSKAIGWYEEDAEDLQLAGFLERARKVAANAKKIPLRVFFQILTGSTNSSLLPSVPLAPDGAALHAATAGGANRFGVSGGNIVTGTGVASAGAIRTDFWSAFTRMSQFQGTEGEPLLEDAMDNEIVVVHNVANAEVFAEAFKQERTLQIVENQAGNDNVGGAAVSNSIHAEGFRIKLWPTQRVTDNDWFVVLNAPEVPKPIFEQIRQGVTVTEENRSNSREARRSHRMGITATMRAGYGIGPAYGTVKVNN